MGVFGEAAAETLKMVEQIGGMVPKVGGAVERTGELAHFVDMADSGTTNVAKLGRLASAAPGHEPVTFSDSTGGVPLFSIVGKSAQIAEVKATGDLSKVNAQVRDATLSIKDMLDSSGGTGFLIDPKLAQVKGRIAITNDHVISDNNDNLFPLLSVRLTDGTELPARVLFRSPTEDLAGLYIPDLGDQVPHLTIASTSDGLDRGQRAYGAGHPSLASRNDYPDLGLHGTPYVLGEDNRFSPVLSEGAILGRVVRTLFRPRGHVGSSSVAEIDHTVPTWRGFSGGGIGVLKGDQFEVVGVNTFMPMRSAPARAVAADYVHGFLKEIARNGLPESGYVKFRPDVLNWQTDRPDHLDLDFMSQIIQ